MVMRAVWSIPRGAKRDSFIVFTNCTFKIDDVGVATVREVGKAVPSMAQASGLGFLDMDARDIWLLVLKRRAAFTFTHCISPARILHRTLRLRLSVPTPLIRAHPLKRQYGTS
jgi:hypothetical protein